MSREGRYSRAVQAYVDPADVETLQDHDISITDTIRQAIEKRAATIRSGASYYIDGSGRLQRAKKPLVRRKTRNR
jgi:hypothetical protein